MNRLLSKKFAGIMLSCATMLPFACACTTDPETNNIGICASMEETEEVIRVFAGDIGRAPEDYVQKRTEYLACIADTDENVDALIGFDDYYTAQEVTTLLEKYDVITDRAYMWPKGETGRLTLFVEDGDLVASIEDYKLQIEADDCNDPDILKDYKSFLEGEYGVFALVVTAQPRVLEEMSSQDDCISYIDVLYNAEAETYAEKVGKTVSYAELPAKPDGAL